MSELSYVVFSVPCTEGCSACTRLLTLLGRMLPEFAIEASCNDKVMTVCCWLSDKEIAFIERHIPSVGEVGNWDKEYQELLDEEKE